MSQQRAARFWNGWKVSLCRGWRRCANKWCAFTIVVAGLTGFLSTAWAQDPAIGSRIFIDPQNLPPPHATESVSNVARKVALPDPIPLQVPPGFTVSIFFEGLSDARNILVAPNGDVLVAESSSGKITRLRDTNGDHKADQFGTLVNELNRPYGMAFYNDQLYVADTRAVWRYNWTPDGDVIGDRVRVTEYGALGSGSGHSTRNLIFHPDGSRFYVAIGSASNVDEEESPRATIQSFAVDGSDQRTHASGLRNPVGMDFYPGTQDLYTVVNERDGLGDGLVPDYLTRVQEGDFFGWPYTYIGVNPQPGFKLADNARYASIVPDLLFAAHSAPLGLVFYDANQFPQDYRGDAFVAFHGSWNSSDPTGYMVVRVPFENNRPSGWYEPFLTGFRLPGTNPAKVFGRPVGIAIAADGALLIADDEGQRIWRVAWQGPN